MKKIFEEFSGKPPKLFKFFYLNFYFGYIPFLILQIILNISGVLPVNFNNEKVYGFKGVIVLIFFSPLVVLLLTVVIWLYFMVGNIILNFIKKFYE